MKNGKDNYDESRKRAKLAREGKTFKDSYHYGIKYAKKDAGDASEKNNGGHASGRRSIGIVIGLLVLISAIFVGILYFNRNGNQAASAESETGGAAGNESVNGSHGNVANIDDNSESYLKIHYIDVGQGDCTLIGCDGEYMIVDGGPDKTGTAVQKYLRDWGVEKLKYAVGTHFDADHIGGLDVVLQKFSCDRVYIPDYYKNSKSYDNLMNVIKFNTIKTVHPSVGEKINLGSAEITFLTPGNEEYENDNDYSIGFMLSYDNLKFLFLGDATEYIEKNMLEQNTDVKADVIKVAHHGSNSSSSENFMNAVEPSIAIISCGENNDYGHPHREVIERINKMNAQVYRTDMQGDILISVVKGKIEVQTER